MPARPPVHRAPGYRERMAWAPMPGLIDRRKRGRAGQRDRQQVLNDEPYCRLCLAGGKHVGSDVVDHIRPLTAGGSDARSNKQGLCTPCHDAKSAEERAASRGSANPAST